MRPRRRGVALSNGPKITLELKEVAEVQVEGTGADMQEAFFLLMILTCITLAVPDVSTYHRLPPAPVASLCGASSSGNG